MCIRDRNCEVLLVRILETAQLGELPGEWHLPPFKADAQLAPGLQALGASAGRLAAPSTFSSPYSTLGLFGARRRTQVMELQLRDLLFVCHFSLQSPVSSPRPIGFETGTWDLLLLTLFDLSLIHISEPTRPY